MYIFADDTKCGKKIKQLWDCLLLQSDLDRISNWGSTSHLLFHDDKTFFLRFRPIKCNSICYTNKLNEKDIQSKPSCKDLGVIFCSDLSWSSHIDKILSKAYRTLHLIKCTFSMSSTISIKKRLYMSLVLPLITYCSPIWHPSLLKDIIALE